MAEANPVQPELPETSTEEFESYINSVMAQMQYRSKAANRSSNQATIFLYGKSGDGKSSTLNYLFDTNIIPTRRGGSVTRKVTEYRCKVQSSLLSEKELNICFIDTPGFNDTGGKNFDAENLVKISSFIDTHPELGHSKLNPDRVYPNIVLIVISASDNRLSGIYSMFSNMLHVLSKLNVVDIFHPNVVIAVTHTMHFSRNGYIEGTKSIEDICRVMTRAHFSFEVPVVFIENFDEKKELEHKGDWKILPDGTRQPLNLFQAMTHLMKQSGDEIGIEAVRLLFRDSRKYNIEPIRTTPQNLDLKSKRPLWKGIVNEEFFLCEDSEVYSILVDRNISDEFLIFPLVYNLQKHKLTDIPSLKTMDLLKVKNYLHPFQLTDEEREWLVHLFEVSRMLVKLDFKTLGVGYSRHFKDTRKQILTIRSLEKMKIRNYVIDVPECCTAEELRKVAIDIVYDKDATWFLMKYLKISFRICYVLFQVEINDIRKFALDERFVNKLMESLPEGADSLEYKFENPTFTNFIKDYALHCITGLYFGGCIEGELYYSRKGDEKKSKKFLSEKAIALRKQLEVYFGCIQSGKDPNREYVLQDMENINELIKCSLTCSGGNNVYHTKSILDINVNKWKNWTSSIENNAICIKKMVNSTFIGDILSNSLDEDIRSYAEKLNPNKTEKQTGLNDLKFQNSHNFISQIDTKFFQEEPVLTRVQATDCVKPWCTVM